MAIYDVDANGATAVAAFLAQYSIAANGDIRFSSGTDTFHVKWLHTALQHKVWDFTTSGDDFVSMSSPNPSTSEALGTIITLQDHTTNYGVRFNIDDTVAQGLFGGSVEQNNASAQNVRYSGLRVLGQVNLASTELQIIQDAAIYTSFWGTGLNQTDSSTLLRLLVKTIDAGVAVDNQTVIVKANEWTDTFAIWETTLGLGEAVAAINTSSDPQNTRVIGDFPLTGHATALATLEGYTQQDVDGLGADNFIGGASYNALTGNQNQVSLYQSVKYALRRGTTDTFFGLDGDLWTGRVYDITVTAGAGGELWVQNEQVTWGTDGVGRIMGFDAAGDDTTTRIILHHSQGLAPTDSDTLVGATNSATNAIAASGVTKLSTEANWFGLWTGSNWSSAPGIGILAGELIFGDSVTSLDGETPVVPQNVTITVNVEANAVGHDPHIFLAKKDPVLASPDYTTLTAVGEAIGSANIDVNEAIPADTPQTGWVGVLKTGTSQYKFYEYSAWSGSQFTLVGTVADTAITAADAIFVAFMYDSATGGGTSKTFSNTFVFDTGTQDYVGWVRQGLETAPDKYIPLSFNVGSNNVTQNVTLVAES